MQRQPTEKISANDVTSEGFQNRETVRTTQQEKNKQHNGQMGRRWKQLFLRGRHSGVQKAHEKTLIIPRQTLERVWREGPSCAVGGHGGWRSHCGEQCGGSQQATDRTTARSSSPSPQHTARQNCDSARRTQPSVHSSRTRTQPECALTDEWAKKAWYMCAVDTTQA